MHLVYEDGCRIWIASTKQRVRSVRFRNARRAPPTASRASQLPLNQVRTSKAMRTKVRAQRPSTETNRSSTSGCWSCGLKSAKTIPNKGVEPDTDTDSEDSIDVERDGPISAHEALRAATAGTAEPRTSPSWKQLFLVSLSFHPLWPFPHIA